MKLTLITATTCALLSVPAFAQLSVAPQTAGATATSARISTPEFVNRAVLSNMFNVQAARLAEQKGDPREANFARQVIADHTKTTDDLKMMVNTAKVNANIATALDSENQRKLAELQNLWGSSFDKAYSRDLR
jgi:putative membrane protein